MPRPFKTPFGFRSLLFRWIWLNRTLFYLALVLGCIAAFTPPKANWQPHLNDKVLHFVFFFGMAFLAQLAHPRVHALFPIVGLSAFGLGIELVQAYLPHREFSLWDWAADCAAVLAYFLILAPLIGGRERDRVNSKSPPG